MIKTFAYELGDTVRITCSGETGVITSRMQSLRSNDQYLLRYQNAEGRAVEEWWSEDALEEIETA